MHCSSQTGQVCRLFCIFLVHISRKRCHFSLYAWPLPRIYDRLKETDHAAAAYCDYIRDSEKRGASEGEEHGQAYLYLANYYLQKGRSPELLEMAREYAQKCVEFPLVSLNF